MPTSTGGVHDRRVITSASAPSSTPPGPSSRFPHATRSTRWTPGTISICSSARRPTGGSRNDGGTTALTCLVPIGGRSARLELPPGSAPGCRPRYRSRCGRGATRGTRARRRPPMACSIESIRTWTASSSRASSRAIAVFPVPGRPARMISLLARVPLLIHALLLAIARNFHGGFCPVGIDGAVEARAVSHDERRRRKMAVDGSARQDVNALGGQNRPFNRSADRDRPRDNQSSRSRTPPPRSSDDDREG